MLHFSAAGDSFAFVSNLIGSSWPDFHSFAAGDAIRQFASHLCWEISYLSCRRLCRHDRQNPCQDDFLKIYNCWHGKWRLFANRALFCRVSKQMNSCSFIVLGFTDVVCLMTQGCQIAKDICLSKQLAFPSTLQVTRPRFEHPLVPPPLTQGLIWQKSPEEGTILSTNQTTLEVVAQFPSQHLAAHLGPQLAGRPSKWRICWVSILIALGKLRLGRWKLPLLDKKNIYNLGTTTSANSLESFIFERQLLRIFQLLSLQVRVQNFSASNYIPSRSTNITTSTTGLFIPLLTDRFVFFLFLLPLSQHRGKKEFVLRPLGRDYPKL